MKSSYWKLFLKFKLHHPFIWLTIFVIWCAFFRNSNPNLINTCIIAAIYLLCICPAVYSIVYYIVPRFLNKEKIIKFFLYSLLIIILSAGLLFLGLYFFYKKTSNSGTLPFSKLNLVFATFMTISFYVSAATAIKFLITRFKTQNYLNQLKKEKAETELKFLKAQINPHFLFNSLNSIYGTIDKQNSLARNTLLKFSEMLRYQLYECNSEKVNLEKEIEYLKNFIALQTMRSEDSLKVKFQIDEHISGNIAPLLFIPFVENAFKYHSNFDDKPNSIHIQLYKKKDLLYFIVTNTIDCTTRVDLTENTGIGIQNVKRRLELLYPGSYTLDILKGQQEYKISLSLNMQ